MCLCCAVYHNSCKQGDCGDSYNEAVKSPGEHRWKAIAKPGNKDNSSSAYFECERCGICADKQLNYIITENEPNERGHFESLTHEFNYVDEEGNLYQPDGNIEIVTTVSDYFEDADSVNVYRIDENGNRVQCESEYDNGVLTFETNHFSTYIFEPYYSCQSTGEHGDENGDGYCDRCDSVLKEFIDFIIKEGVDTQIDSENNLLFGNDILTFSTESISDLFEFGNIFVEEKETGKIATGDIVCLTDDSGEVCKKLTVVVFGDVNGDGWYDGQDAVLVSCLANGMLTKDDVSEAVYTAADCNHDGVIDLLDVDLLNQAGTLLANIDQSKPTEVLLETSSEYVEYLDLIDQSPKIEAEDDTDTPEVDVEPEEIPEADTEDSTQQDAKVDIWKMILNFIKSIFEMLLSYIPMPIK